MGQYAVLADNPINVYSVASEQWLANRPAREGRLVITRGSEVKLEPVKWVIPDWIPERSLVLLAGREGLGKSTIACSIAAQITAGTLEDSVYEDPRSVLYLHSEDSRSLTVAPRLRAAGADMDRVLFIDVRSNEHDILQLPRDIKELERVIEANDVGLVVLDAATSLMASSGRSDRQVREYLEPLSRMADRQNCVVLGLVHFSKRNSNDSGLLILGSIAWSQVPRSVLSVAANASKKLIVANTKGNLASRMRSVRCQINTVELECDGETAEVGVVEWLGETSEDPRDLLSGQTDAKEIDQWLRDFLRDGPKQANEVFVAADAAGFSKDQAKRAKKRCGVAAKHPGGVGPWYWELGS